jgi:nickel/cobalt transporter (NicO) family protein
VIEGADAAYVTAMTIGALHGVEPGHGWPVAATYAMGWRCPWIGGTIAGTLIGGAHLVSSLAVVALFVLLDRWVDLTDSAWVGQVAGAALIVMGILQWRRGGHSRGDEHKAGSVSREGLWGIAAFAFVLGFAHEEEFAIIALCAGQASCWGVMAAYALTVAAAILVLTLLSIAAIGTLGSRIEGWHYRLPRISAAILIAMGIAYVSGVL